MPCWHLSFHLVFGYPLFPLSGISILHTFLSMCSSSLLILCQFNRLSVIFLEACTTLVVPRMCSFLILSLRVTPHDHRSIHVDSILLYKYHISLTFSPLYRPVPPALDSPFYRPLAPALDSHSQRPQTASTTSAIADSHHPTPFESVTYT